MTTRWRWGLIGGLLMGLGLWGAGAEASTIFLGGSGIAAVACSDGDPCDGAVLPGVISLTTPNAALTAQLSGVSSTQPALGAFDMDLTYSLTTDANTPAGFYVIGVSQDGLGGAIDSWTATVGGVQTNGAQTVFYAFADTTGQLFGTQTPLCSAGPSGASPVGMGCVSGALNSPLFSLSEFVGILAPNDGVTVVSGDALLVASPSNREVVPEPTTLILLGTGLLGVGYLRRSRARS